MAVKKVREVLDRLRKEGWYLDRTTGSHRQFRHAQKPGLVTVPGRPSDDLQPGTYKSICLQAGWRK